jgi:hypothetical protein
MADEVTTTILAEIIHTEAIIPELQNYQAEHLCPQQFALNLGVPSNGASVVKLPRFTSAMGTVGDTGTSVATAFNASEATALSNTALDMAEGSITIIEYGVQREISRSALEDNINGGTVIDWILRDGSRILATAQNDDMCALFASFTNSSGSTGVDATLANIDSAVTAIRARGTYATSLVGVLDDAAMADVEANARSIGTSWAVYPSVAATMMPVGYDPGNGLARVDGFVFSYRGIDLHQTGLTETANTGADVVSAIFPRGDDPGNYGHASIASAYKRLEMPELDTDISKRTTKIVLTSRWGCGLVYDGTGQKLVTDA